MKHTIKGKHDHLYAMERDSESPDIFPERKKICMSRPESANIDWMSGQLELRHKISRRWGTCWLCFKETDLAGGYDDPGCKKILFFECKKCGR
jgi:hypothetical protein